MNETIRRESLWLGRLALGAMIALLVGCGGSREGDAIRGDIRKVPVYALGHKSDGDLFARDLCARIEKIPDPNERIRLSDDLVNALFAVDLKKEYPIENVDREQRQESLRCVGLCKGTLEDMSDEVFELMVRCKRPMLDCWEVKFRFIERARDIYAWVRQHVTGFDPTRNFGALVDENESWLNAYRKRGLFTPDEFEAVSNRFSAVAGRPLKAE